MTGYLGEPLPLAELLYNPAHSLEKQAYLARELVSGHVNVDGTGVAWWPEGEDTPLHYVTEHTPWADPNLAGLASRLTGNMIIAALRSGTPGIGYGIEHVPPFVSGDLGFAHNGWIEGSRLGWGRELIEEWGELAFSEFTVWNDSRLIFLTVLDRIEAGLEPTKAVVDVIHRLGELTHTHDVPASLNLLVGDGQSLMAVRAAVGVQANSLYWKRVENNFWFASEPLDGNQADPNQDGVWVEVEPASMMVADLKGLQTYSLDPSLQGE